jgi:hypothetical protein
MATWREYQAGWSWPAQLVTYDPSRWTSREAWHLERARTAPSGLVALNEIRASLGRGPVRLMAVRAATPPKGGA